jgi:hypothetical protein
MRSPRNRNPRFFRGVYAPQPAHALVPRARCSRGAG